MIFNQERTARPHAGVLVPAALLVADGMPPVGQQLHHDLCQSLARAQHLSLVELPPAPRELSGQLHAAAGGQQAIDLLADLKMKAAEGLLRSSKESKEPFGSLA